MSTDELIREHESISDMLPQLTLRWPLWKGMLALVEDEMNKRVVNALP